jgi:hypothetical protein
MEGVFNWLVEALSEFWLYVAGMAIGIISKISYEIYMKRTLTILQWLAVVAMSICTGYITAAYCHANHWHGQAQIAVPIATLLGEKIFMWLVQNHRQILDAALALFKTLGNGGKR